MPNRMTSHIRSDVVAFAALFFALTGGAYALDGPLPGQNQVGSDDIINNEVKGVDIGPGEVKNGDIGAFEIKANNIAPDSLGGAKIADRSVKNADLGLGASSSNTIADGGIQAIDVKANTLTGGQIDELSLDFALLQRRITDSCAAGQAIRAVAQNGTVTCEAVGGSGGGSSWLLAGNSGTTGADFLGTTDNQPLSLRVNNAPALRLEPASDGTDQSPNVIGGTGDNSVTPGVHSATIGGGGRGVPADPATANRVTDHQGVVGGGANNQAGDDAGTVDDRTLATVGGGGNNVASGELSTVGGGFFDQATGSRATVGGGQSNEASGDWGTIGGGFSGIASGERATVGGGNGNIASGSRATVPGGSSNVALGDFSLAAGRDAQANHQGAFVWADSNPFMFFSTAQDQFNVRSIGGARFVSGIDGSGNPTSGVEMPAGTSGLSSLVNGQPFDIGVNGARGFRIEPATDGTNPAPNVIGGSTDNSVTPGVYSATIGGGGRPFPGIPGGNRVTDNFGTIGGGSNNAVGNLTNAGGDHATVGGGTGNVATETNATIGGGLGNTASGYGATVPGGISNAAQGDESLAAGFAAVANHDGSFVWADTSDQVHFFTSTTPNQFLVRATGGTRFVSAINASTGAPTAGVELAPGGGSWSSLSDVAAKRAIERVSGREVLQALASVPISTWSYRAQDGSIRHIGPMAQDFYRAFGVGEDRRHIASVDADGVALAAIKGLNRRLNQKVERLERERRAERRRRHRQERRMDRLEARLAALERGGGR